MLLKPWQCQDCFRGSWWLDVAPHPCWQVEPLPVTSGLLRLMPFTSIMVRDLLLLKTIPSPTSSAVNTYKTLPLVKDQTSYFQGDCFSLALLLRELGRRVKPGETKWIAHCSTLNGKSSQSGFCTVISSISRFCKNKILNQQMSAQAACLSNLALRCACSCLWLVLCTSVESEPYWVISEVVLWLSVCREKAGEA